MSQPRNPVVIVAAVAVLLVAVIAYQALTGNDPHTTTSGPTPQTDVQRSHLTDHSDPTGHTAGRTTVDRRRPPSSTGEVDGNAEGV